MTDYKRHAEQCKQLQHMGIKFVPSHLGQPLVLRKSFEAIMGVEPQVDEALLALDNYARVQNG